MRKTIAYVHRLQEKIARVMMGNRLRVACTQVGLRVHLANVRGRPKAMIQGLKELIYIFLLSEISIIIMTKASKVESVL